VHDCFLHERSYMFRLNASHRQAVEPYKKVIYNVHINRGAKMQIYKTLIRPVVIYGCEFWTMKKGRKYSMQILEENYRRNLRPSEKREGMENKK
jgi:hypothetical protein